MNWRAIWAIMRKDLRVVVQNKGVVLPIILLPVILFAVASLVDYPLRTPALSVLLALAVVFATRRDSPRPASDRP